MNIKNGISCRISALMLAVALTCGASMGAMAAEKAAAAEGAPALDFDRKGSVSIVLEDYTGRKMTDGSLALYQVAAPGYDDGNMSYIFTDAFADCGQELTEENLGDHSAELAAVLEKWVNEQDASAAAEAGIDNGEVTFSDLQPGIYLVVQKDKSEDFYLIDPFLVSIPLLEQGTWIYDVDASPKAETKDSEKTDVSGTTTPGATPGGGSSGATSGKLPQTGQLNWPIPFLAGGGLLLMLIGGALVISDRKRKNHAS